MKCIPAFFLSTALLLSPALAVGAEDRFPTVKEYPGYADVKESEAEKTLKFFTAACPKAEITLLSGGQPVYYYMISAE